jgi:hypothetical protein
VSGFLVFLVLVFFGHLPLVVTVDAAVLEIRATDTLQITFSPLRVIQCQNCDCTPTVCSVAPQGFLLLSVPPATPPRRLRLEAACGLTLDLRSSASPSSSAWYRLSWPPPPAPS